MQQGPAAPQYRRNKLVVYSSGASFFFAPGQGSADPGAIEARSAGTNDCSMGRLNTEPEFRRSLSRRCAPGLPLLAAASIGLAVGTAGPVQAQETGAPTRIDRADPDDRPARQPTVRIEELGPPGAGSIGILADRTGGLGAELWRDASLREVVAQLAQLPAANRSPMLHDLQRRLLLTVALPPAGKAKTGFTQARLHALLRMGALRDTIELAARAKIEPQEPFPVIRARFLSGDSKTACTAVAAVAAVGSGATPFIEQARIACHVLSDHGERAEIALRLLHEQGAPPPRPFERAVLAAAAGRAPRTLAKPFALTLALLRHSKARLKSADFKPLSTGALIAFSANRKMNRGLRIRALERASMQGAPVHRELAALYAGVRAPAKEIAEAPATRLRDFDSRARTRLYLAAKSAKDRSRRLRILAAWWRLAAGAAARGDDGAEMLAARQTVPFLGNIDPSPDSQDHAAHIARAWFATGRNAQALAWYRFLKAAPFRNPADLHRITVPAMLAGRSTPAIADTVKSWIGFKRWTDKKSATAHLADLKALLDGLGRLDDIPRVWRRETPEERAAARTTGAGRDAALFNAAAAGRRGLTVLRVLTLVNGRPLRRVPRRLLRDAVFGLRAVGLDREARQLAIEAALARRL